MYRKTLLAAASVIALGLAASGPAWAQDSNTDQIDESTIDRGSAASNNTDVEDGSVLGVDNDRNIGADNPDASVVGRGNTVDTLVDFNNVDNPDGSVLGANNQGNAGADDPDGSTVGNNNRDNSNSDQNDIEGDGVVGVNNGENIAAENMQDNTVEDGSVLGIDNDGNVGADNPDGSTIGNNNRDNANADLNDNDDNDGSVFGADNDHNVASDNPDDSVVGNNNTTNQADDGSVAGNNNAVNEAEAEEGGVAVIGGGNVSVSEVEIVSEAELVGVVSKNPVITVGGVGIEGSADNATAVVATGNARGTQSNIGGIGTMQVTSGFNNLQQNSVSISAQGSFTPAANGGAGTSGTN